MQTTSTPITIGDDELAAALAAVGCYIEQERPADEPALERVPAWRRAAALEAQGLPPACAGDHPSWGTAARAARAIRWSYGIIGM